jgi:DNA-binding response OmpR family regulator
MNLSKANILVVDDEAGVLLTLTSILRQEGYHVDGAENGQKAIAAVREHSYDLVLTDLNMPGIGGMEVLAEVQRCSPNTVTVVITGYGSLDSALQAIRLGAYEYLLKPTEVEEVKQAVRRSLDRKRLSELDRLYELSRLSAASTNLDQLTAEISRAGCDVLSLKQLSVVTFDAYGEAESRSPFGEILEEDAVRTVLQSGEAVTQDRSLAAAERWAASHGLRAYAMVPGKSAGRLVCVVCANNGDQPYEFHASALRFLQALADQAALAIGNINLVAELRRNNAELDTANRKLRDLDQLKSQFLSIATHELRTTLSIG